jgi:hypothetical protein
MRKAIFFALAFLLLLPLVKADIYLTNCTNIGTPGETYYLTQDIIDSSASTCMLITADNVVLDCQGHTIDGMDTADTLGIYINGSIIQSTPCCVSETGNITIRNCTINDWDKGIFIKSSNSNILSNIFLESNSYGILIKDYVSDNNILNTVLKYNSYGIYTSQSSLQYITNTTFISNSQGLHFYYGDTNTIKGSKFENSTIWIEYSGNSHFYNNLFNQSGIVTSAYVNFWNTTRQAGTRIYSAGTEIGGNYWTNATGNGYSDTCTDADKDGFCDDPYVLATDNVDYLALSDEYCSCTNWVAGDCYNETHRIYTRTCNPSGCDVEIKYVEDESCTTLVSGVPLLSRTLVGIAIGFGVLAFMLKTLFDIKEPKKVIEYFIALAVIVLTVIALIVLFA